ncbi:MAG: ATPase, T2SS/T4P/T4SS family [Polaromonas sp.]|nr:ATPase, T2SS/T4P/T4SS family [Polaromonas sp.]
MKQSEPKVIHYRALTELPDYVNVASGPKGRFPLPDQRRASMFILELPPDGKPDHVQYAVVSSKDLFNTLAYTATTQRIKAQGGEVTITGTADGAVFAALEKDLTTGTDAHKAERDYPIIQDIKKLTQQAIDYGTSDIHIELRGEVASVRMRVNGNLRVYSTDWTKEYVEAMARAMHTMADDDSKPPTYSSDMQMKVSLVLQSQMKVNLRVQVSPAWPLGFDVVLRVLKVGASAKRLSYTELGFYPEHLEMLEYANVSPRGLVLLCGTTGSGKSTTVQTMMYGIHEEDPGLKLISIEDPPEYILPGTQIPVARRSGDENPFISAMRNTMRMDPDVIMVGEIRDEESAKLMVGMVQSGHRVITTVHTESALGSVGRLRGFGVESDVLAARGFLTAMIFQRLVPVLCNHCKLDFSPADTSISKAMHERIRHVTVQGDTLYMANPKGCSKCHETGISGRTVCAEIVVPNDDIRDFIGKNDVTGAIRYWEAQRPSQDSVIGATALQHGILKMRQGLISPVHLEKELGLMHDFIQARKPSQPNLGLDT